MNKVYSELDGRIKAILLLTDGWLVGGSMESIILDKDVKDYDIIVPDRAKFHNIINHLSKRSGRIIFNNYGGIKLKLEELNLDIWCEELSHFIMSARKLTYIYNHKRGVLLKNEI